MPYDPNTGVAEGLLLILDRKVGRRQASILLHDHLERPEDQATRLAITLASRAKVRIERSVHGDVLSTRVGFKTKVGDRQWDGDSIGIPAIPMALAFAAVGRPLNSVIGHPLLPTTPIASSDGDQDRRLTMERRDVPMRHLRPGRLTRALTGIRRMDRRGRLARDLHAHHGYTFGVIALAVVTGLAAFLLTGLPVALIRGIGTGSDHLPDAFGAVFGLLAALLAARTMARHTVQDAVVADYVERVTTAVIAEGHPGSDDFDDELSKSS